jgi:ATP-binding cassette subfamily B protein
MKTDQKVRENIKKDLKNTTKVIVAQRIGSIMDADKILVIDKGKEVGYGNHEELMKKCKVYKDIALSQLSRKELTKHG